MDNISDPRFDAYIAAQADFARPVLTHFRQLVHDNVSPVVETIKWRFPHFVYRDKNLCSMAAFKGHAAISFWYSEDATPARATEGGMGHLGRITGLADLPGDTELIAMITRSARMIDAGAKPQWIERRKQRLPLPIPPALQNAIDGDPAAAAVWARLSPSQIRDYAEWIGEAKKEETRERRVAQAVEWIAQGKDRNWKYR